MIINPKVPRGALGLLNRLTKNMMQINFGVVSKYFDDKGFGFARGIFNQKWKNEIFFHIKNIKKTRRDLAEKLSNEDDAERVCFWFESEITNKGEQVKTVLTDNEIKNAIGSNLLLYINQIETMWNDLNATLPFWLHEITVDLVGESKAEKLSIERENQKKLKRLEFENECAAQKAQRYIESVEFDALVAEFKPLAFKTSKEVSNYIVRHQLGRKYKHVSGILRMGLDGNEWDFKGGFPTDIYRNLCRALGLNNKKTAAKAIKFTSFNNLELPIHHYEPSFTNTELYSVVGLGDGMDAYLGDGVWISSNGNMHEY